MTILNAGTEVLTGDVALLGDLEAFTITAGGGWVELAPGANHVVSVAVSPPEVGPFAATLRTLGGCHSVDFSVVGVDNSPICQVVPPELAAGAVLVGIPVNMDVTVSNAGETSMTVDPQIVSSVFTITQGGGPHVVAPGDTLLVRIRFLASEAGDYEGVVLLGSSYCADVPVTASAYAGEYACDWSGLTLGDWGEQVIGIASARDFTYRNTGDYPLADVNFSVSGSAFAMVSGAGPVTVAPGASHVVRVVFSPSAVVTYTGNLTPSTGACGPLPLIGEGIEPPATVGDALIVAFDPQGETTTFTTSAPNQPVTAYLLLLSPNGYMDLNGWECTVEVETAGPAPAILWNVAYNGLNIAQPPQFIVGLPVPQIHQAVMLLATATVFVPSPDQEIAFHILPSSYPSIILPPGYPVQQPVWAGPPGLALQRRPPCVRLRDHARERHQRRRAGAAAANTRRGQPGLRRGPGRRRGDPHVDLPQSGHLDILRRVRLRRPRLCVPARQRHLDHRGDLVPRRARRRPARAGALHATGIGPALRRDDPGRVRTGAGLLAERRRRRARHP